MEIQNEIEDLVKTKQERQIEDKIKSFDMCTKDENIMRKRAGLYGLSVVTVALYQKGSISYLSQLVDPVIVCFRDKDKAVQQAACDSMFNIIKIVREGILDKQEIFKKIFDAIINLIIDSTTLKDDGGQGSLKDWAKSVDDLLKN